MQSLPADSQPVTTLEPRRHSSAGLKQAYDLRDFTANLALALREDLTDPKTGKLRVMRDEYGKPVDAAALAQLVKAWSEARDAIRVLRGKPLPGSYRPEPRSSKAKRKAVVIEPTVLKPE